MAETGARIGFAVTGSFCTFARVFEQMRLLAQKGYQLVPIMSENAYATDTRFGRASDWVHQAEEICGRTSGVSNKSPAISTASAADSAA